MFKYITVCAATVLTALVGTGVSALPKSKILVAGSLEPYRHKYYESVAKNLASNEETKDVVYLLTHDISDTSRY